jgi:hypothetical protein
VCAVVLVATPSATSAVVLAKEIISLANTSEAAREYVRRGFAVARIQAGQKRPTDKAWNTYSFPVDQLRDSDNLGIQAGRLSRDAVCVDIDCRAALGDAGNYLPPTSMVEGRPGKPRSHRWYRVNNIPAELEALSDVAGGIGGPRTRRFRHGETKRVIIEFLGTGSQAVAPPSRWAKEGREEIREWDTFGEPAVVDCGELFAAVCRLAAAHGWVDRTPKRSRSDQAVSESLDSELTPMTPGETVRQARSYIAHIPPAVAGEGGDAQTFRVACVLVLEFGLSVEDALPLMQEFNRRCCPPWSTRELLHKLEMADNLENERGKKVQNRLRQVLVRVNDEDALVHVGLDCSGVDGSFVELAPSLFAGLDKVADRRVLAPELANIEWYGRDVLLTPASTVATNKQEVWGEHFLAKLLSQHGATVKSVRLPDLNGRRRTYAQRDGTEQVVEPPLHAGEAAAAAELAAERGRQVYAYRRSLPRNQASPRLSAACEFVREFGVLTLTQTVLDTAKERGIGRSTLQRALKKTLSLS